VRRFDLIVTCVCCLALSYFAWHAWKGPRGYPYQEQLQARLAMLDNKFDTIQQQRVRLEHKVGLLRPESIDPDILDEMARSQLQMVRPGDLVIYTAH